MQFGLRGLTLVWDASWETSAEIQMQSNQNTNMVMTVWRKKEHFNTNEQNPCLFPPNPNPSST